MEIFSVLLVAIPVVIITDQPGILKFVKLPNIPKIAIFVRF